MVPVGGRVPPKPILHWQQLLVFQLSGPATLATLALVRPPVPTPTRPSHPGTLPPPELPPAKWVHIDKTVNVKEMEEAADIYDDREFSKTLHIYLPVLVRSDAQLQL